MQTTRSCSSSPQPIEQKLLSNDASEIGFEPAIQREAGGVQIFKDVSKMIKEVRDINKQHSDALAQCHAKYLRNFEKTDQLILYGTTRNIVLYLIRLSQQSASPVNARIQKLNAVASDLNEGIKTVTSIEQSTTLKKRLKTAHRPVYKSNEELEKRRRENHKLKSELNSLSTKLADSTLTEKKWQDLKDKQCDLKSNLSRSDNHTATSLYNLQKEVQNYQKQASKLFKDAQKKEEKRLQLITETLIKFLEAQELEDIEEIKTRISVEHKPKKDVNEWELKYIQQTDDNDSEEGEKEDLRPKMLQRPNSELTDNRAALQKPLERVFKSISN
ncbi:unnamed protein product [Didymodactylos carnosus]|uniref:Uncharacterized protein n=1 Tax=Didymodactylos carnosus TaxID=1234261 RepID=A0A814EJD0_9BILA|nr:unnamed protein product [Didymodactylos carnosus]CAF3741474.1 unnamed protein product [Didymodactylos carnosus]